MTDATSLDTTGLLCPLPVLKLRKRLKTLETGARIVMQADDPASAVDVPHFCAEAGHLLVESGERDGIFCFTIEKRG